MNNKHDRIQELTEQIDRLHTDRDNARGAVEYARIHNLIAKARSELKVLREHPDEDDGGPCCIGHAYGSDHSPDCTLSPNYNGRGAEFPSYE